MLLGKQNQKTVDKLWPSCMEAFYLFPCSEPFVFSGLTVGNVQTFSAYINLLGMNVSANEVSFSMGHGDRHSTTIRIS